MNKRQMKKKNKIRPRVIFRAIRKIMEIVQEQISKNVGFIPSGYIPTQKK